MELATPIDQGMTDVDTKMASTDYATAKIHLYSNDLSPGPNTQLTDLTEATFDGYAALTITWSAAFSDLSQTPVSSGGLKLFVQDGTGGEAIFGAYITNSAGTKLLAAARLDNAPFVFVNDGDALPLNVVLGLVQGWVSTELEN